MDTKDLEKLVIWTAIIAIIAFILSATNYFKISELQNENN